MTVLLRTGACWALCAWTTAHAQSVDIEIEAEDAPVVPAPVTAPAPPAPNAELEALRARVAALEAAALATPPAVAAEATAEADAPALPAFEGDAAPAGRVGRGEKARWWDLLDLRVSGFIQAQYEHSDLSQDEITPDGEPYNRDRFSIRRGRVRVDRYFRYAHVGIELDANTVRGPFVSLRRAEASFFLPNRDAELPPYVMVTAGLSEIPFGAELRQGNRQRLFMERTTASLAFFRGEPDVGVRVSGAVGPMRYAVAVQNGVPLDDRPGAVTQSFQKKPTVVGRLGAEFDAVDRFEGSAGVSFLVGRGFSAGTPATKSQLLWNDFNQDGNVTLNELVSAPGQAAVPSQTFRRWGVNADLGLGVRSPAGWTRAWGEVTIASNLDRSLYVADPIATGYDLREFAWTAGLTQDITSCGVVGLRVDHYDPNSDLFEARRGQFIPASLAQTTFSPVAGVILPRRGRLMFQYDHVRDALGRDGAGEPVDLKNDRWTLRLQVEF